MGVLRYEAATGAFVDQPISAAAEVLSEPTDIVFGADGSIYVAGFRSESILRYVQPTPSCDDGDACTVNTCSASSGCVAVRNGIACEGGGQ